MSNLVTDNDLLEYNYSDYLNPPQDFPRISSFFIKFIFSKNFLNYIYNLSIY